jgi:hypothetical protein
MCVVTCVLCYIFLLYEYILISPDRSRQRVLNDLKRTRLSCRLNIWLKAIILLHHLSRQWARPAKHRKTEKERQLAERRGGKGRSQIIRRRNPVLHEWFNMLWKQRIFLSFDYASIPFIILKIDLVLPPSSYSLSTCSYERTLLFRTPKTSGLLDYFGGAPTRTARQEHNS